MVSGLLARCIILTIGILYPAYRSYKSLINSNLREVVNCLRYWTVFAIFSACETVTDIILSWFPFYYWIKIALILWIVSPTGSTFLYKRFIQPLLKEREQEIDQLLEDTKKRSYSALLDLTNKGFRYASNVVLNSGILGQTYLGETLKRSFSANDISTKPKKNRLNQPATVHEESDEETDSELRNRFKEDQRYLTEEANRKPPSKYLPDNSSDDYEMTKLRSGKNRNGATNGNNSKRQVKGTKSTKKSDEQEVVNSNETDEEIENMMR